MDDLISCLLDKANDLAVRDDCAMDLAKFDDMKVLEALFNCGSDKNEDDMIQSSCGESLAEIMVRNSSLRKEYIKGLSKIAKVEFRSFVLGNKPEWKNEVSEL